MHAKHNLTVLTVSQCWPNEICQQSARVRPSLAFYFPHSPANFSSQIGFLFSGIQLKYYAYAALAWRIQLQGKKGGVICWLALAGLSKNSHNRY